jgi:hypothetical protein
VPASRTVLAGLAAAACGWLLATRVFTALDFVRITALREPAAVQSGPIRLDVRDERAAALRPPFALIARARNDGDTPLRLAFRLDGREVCRRELAAGRSQRMDCAVTEWSGRAAGEVLVEPGASQPWALEYLELASHHGRSTGWLHAVVLPRDAWQVFTRPSLFVSLVAGIAIGAMLLVTPQRLPRRLRGVHLAASGIAIVPLALAAVAPLVSPYRIVLSAWTFAGWVAIPLLPRVAAPARVLLATPWRATCLLAVSVFVLAMMYGATVAGASDEYGYVSQADLWLSGRLAVDQPFVVGAPWPEEAPWWFSPLGYRPHATDPGAIVPVYSPGLPLMLAAAKLVGGHAAMFLIVPLCAVLLVLMTYALGRRMSSGIAPLVAAWLIATSPLVLAHAMVTMSDVPVAAAWAGAFCLLLGTSRWSAAGAGLLCGLAVLIRPNLAPLVGVFALRYVLPPRATGRRELARPAIFLLAASPAAIVVASVNSALYGSPATSGYGPLAVLFDPGRILPNLRNYLVRLVESHTPAVLLGFAALLVPLRSLWPDVRERALFIVIGLFVAVLWAIYCAWVVFDSWWFGRFLLPTLPFAMLGVGACADAIFRRPARWSRVLAVVGVVALGLAQLHFARTHSVFEIGPNTRRYAVAAELTRRVTPPNSVVFTLNHSGSIRYYGERVTINIGNIRDRRPLEEIVAWLAGRGVRTFATFEDWEIDEFSRRFEGAPLLDAFKRPPLAILRDPGRVLVYELSDGAVASGEPIVVTGLPPGRHAVRPGLPPTLVLSRTP